MERRKKRMIIKTVAIAVFIVVLYVLYPFMYNIVEHPPGTEYIDIPREFSYKFTRTFNFTASKLTSYTFNITIPVSNEFQKLNVYEGTTHQKRVLKDYNRTWWSYSLSGNSEIEIVYEGVSYAKVWNIDSSGDIDEIPQNLKNQYNHAEYVYVYENGKSVKKYVITPSSYFRKLTEDITANVSGVVGKLRKIYDFIVQNFYYKKESGSTLQSANETFVKRGGDCDELSFLFVSMARSIGIPAWVEYGLLYDGNTWGGHAWVRTVVPESGRVEYVNIDLTTEVGKEDYGRGFLIRDPYRITEWQDDGNSRHLSSYYELLSWSGVSGVQLKEKVNIEYSKSSGHYFIPVGSTIPSWLILLLIVLIVAVVFLVIIRW